MANTSSHHFMDQVYSLANAYPMPHVWFLFYWCHFFLLFSVAHIVLFFFSHAPVMSIVLCSFRQFGTNIIFHGISAPEKETLETGTRIPRRSFSIHIYLSVLANCPCSLNLSPFFLYIRFTMTICNYLSKFKENLSCKQSVCKQSYFPINQTIHFLGLKDI